MKQQGLGGVRFESQRFRLLSIVVGCFLISVTFLLSTRPEATVFDTREYTSPSGIARCSGHASFSIHGCSLSYSYETEEDYGACSEPQDGVVGGTAEHAGDVGHQDRQVLLLLAPWLGPGFPGGRRAKAGRRPWPAAGAERRRKDRDGMYVAAN